MPQAQGPDPRDVAPTPDADVEDVNEAEIEDEDEDDLFGEPPGSDLDDPADDDW